MSLLRKRYLPFAAVLGAACAVAMSSSAHGDGARAAPPSTASFTASDFAWRVTGDSTSDVTIAMGGTVSFAYPSGGSFHNADFAGGPAPSACAQSAGSVSGSVPPLPNEPTGPGWAGTCTFTAPGTYSFICDAHPQMAGTITVVDPAAPTTTTTTTHTTTTTTPATTTTTPATTTTAPVTTSTTTPATGATTSTPAHGGPASTAPPTGTTSAATTPKPAATSGPPAYTVPPSQKGTAVKGTIATPDGPAKVVVTAFVSSRLLSAKPPKQPKPVSVGAVTKRTTGKGTTAFSVPLNAKAKAALKRRHRLTVTVKILVTPTSGRASTKTLMVTVKPA